MTKINVNVFNEDKIINSINDLKSINLCEDSESGLIFFGIFKDNNDDLYACISSQLDQKDLIKFYNFQALDETLSNLEVRYDLLKKSYDPSVPPETIITVQDEFNELRINKLNYLYANRHNYLESLKEEAELSLKTNLYLLNYICDTNNLKATDDIIILDHVTIKDKFIYYFTTELQNKSLIFYNLNEGFGLLENTNDTAFLIPTASFSDNTCDNNLNINTNNINIYESSIFSRKNYNTNKFLSKEVILKKINSYITQFNIENIQEIKEINHFLPCFLFLV